ncbi:hypothetical protein F0365_11470 [Nonlabens sp. Ci31]|jgi:hypothetical protein|uniref:hypothetical protein n=1 Tax=Nonlabens sp. Ci31 TaxID=2608253 RepID=UPI0014649E29|nr:hypothetical protein [Nonlabens sp. Ci31]QJP34964.1 hypothetical protein F0365_11470 [Nonlabens sp. Ci31]
MKSKLLYLLIIAILFSCTEDDGTATTITCADNTYFAWSTSDMANFNGIINVVQNTTSNIATSSFNLNSSISNSITARNNPSAWDKVNRQSIWFNQENQSDVLVYDESLNTITATPLPASTQGILGRITAPVFLNGTLYVMDMDINPAQPSYTIHTLNTSTGVLGPVLTTISLNPGTTSRDTSFTFATATSNGVDTLFFRIANNIHYYNVNTGIITTYNSLPITGDNYSGLEYHQDKDVFYVVSSINNNVDLVEIKINAANNYLITPLFTGLNVNENSMQLEWKDCGKRLHLISNYPASQNSGLQDRTEITEFNLDFSPTFVTQTFNSFIFGFVHKEI